MIKDLSEKTNSLQDQVKEIEVLSIVYICRCFNSNISSAINLKIGRKIEGSL